MRMARMSLLTHTDACMQVKRIFKTRQISVPISTLILFIIIISALHLLRNSCNPSLFSLWIFAISCALFKDSTDQYFRQLARVDHTSIDKLLALSNQAFNIIPNVSISATAPIFGHLAATISGLKTQIVSPRSVVCLLDH